MLAIDRGSPHSLVAMIASGATLLSLYTNLTQPNTTNDTTYTVQEVRTGYRDVMDSYVFDPYEHLRVGLAIIIWSFKCWNCMYYILIFCKSFS